ncbi:uncharacterized protein [Heterodontus francisci]|uniref:uncharacterized protein n=1 Tax=Heterodontus francisci TaxID=7792 RepID=UPI00355AF8EF
MSLKSKKVRFPPPFTGTSLPVLGVHQTDLGQVMCTLVLFVPGMCLGGEHTVSLATSEAGKAGRLEESEYCNERCLDGSLLSLCRNWIFRRAFGMTGRPCTQMHWDKRTHNSRETAQTGGGIPDLRLLSTAEDEALELAGTQSGHSISGGQTGIFTQRETQPEAGQLSTSEEEEHSENALSHDFPARSTSADTFTSVGLRSALEYVTS